VDGAGPTRSRRPRPVPRPSLGARVRLGGVRWAARTTGRRWAGAPAVASGTAQADLVSFVPPLGERLARLHAMGAHAGADPATWGASEPTPEASGARPGIDGPGGRRRSPLGRLGRVLRAAVTWPLRAAVALAALAGAAVFAWFSLVLYALLLSPVVALLHALLR
jgi:hypothetical protein